MLRCIIVRTRLGLRRPIHCRWMSSDGQSKAATYSPRRQQPEQQETDTVIDGNDPPHPPPQAGKWSIERKTNHSSSNKSEGPRLSHADATSIPSLSRLPFPSTKAKVTVESLMERMSGNRPDNLKSKNPLASALASIQREKDEYNQIFGAPSIDSLVSSWGKASSNPNVYSETESYKQYRTMMDEILSSESFHAAQFRRTVIEWLLSDEKSVEVRLPSLDHALKHGLETCQNEDDFTSRADKFRKELAEQRGRFFEHTGLDQSQMVAVSRALSLIGRVCAKRARSLPLEIAWEKAKEAGIELPGDSLVNYLHVVSSYPGRANFGLLGSVPDLSTLDGNQEHRAMETDTANTSERDLRAEIAIFHDLLFKPSNQSLSVRVKFLVSQGKAAQAEALFEQVVGATTDNLRQRTCIPIFDQYLEQGNIPGALKFFSKIKEIPSVAHLDVAFIRLIAAIAESGYFSPSATPIEGALSLGYNPPCGPGLFNQLANELAQMCVEISSVSARRLYNALEGGFRGTLMAQEVRRIPPLSPLKPLNKPALPGDLIAHRVTVDRHTGACPRSGVTLRLLEFSADQKRDYMNNLLRVGKERFLSFTAALGTPGMQNTNGNAMTGFTEWLSKRNGKPYTVIIDGGNVGYHMQNFDEGRFNYHQLQFMVDYLESLHEKPLIVLPWRLSKDWFYFNPSMYGEGQRQFLTGDEKYIRDRLLAERKLYRVASRWHDDLFLMAATVSDQAGSRKGKDLSVEPENPDGRWPGARPVLVTNDQLRDNWPEVLDRRLFRRWYSSCVVNYKFVGFVGKDCADDEIAFSPGEFFSREIQCNTLRTARGEETVWHFPVSDWGYEDWFCIKIPN